MSKGNAKADEAAKEAGAVKLLLLERQSDLIDHDVLINMQNASEKQKWISKGAIQQN